MAKTENTVTVVIDILRATTSFCTAFDFGAKAIVPLETIDEAITCKSHGKLVAAERDGLKPEFADFSNSAFDYMVPDIFGKTIYYTTTNGTQAISMASKNGPVAIGSFLNIAALCNYLEANGNEVIILCAGWKNNYCIEDALCAGAIVERLSFGNQFLVKEDAAVSSLILWRSCNNDPEPLIVQSSHYQRLKKLGYEGVLKHSLQIDSSSCVPILHDGKITNLKNTL
jgi:2-phosphosulfolactate phosphatase